MNSVVFVLPTCYFTEGLPISVLEVMACGLPVIPTNYRCIPDVVSEGKNGFFVPAQNSAAIAEKIILLHHDRGLQLKIAQNNIKKINHSYTEQHFAQKFIK